MYLSIKYIHSKFCVIGRLYTRKKGKFLNMWQLHSSIPSENWKGSIIWKRRKFYFVSEIPTQWTCTVVGVSSFKLSTSHSCVEDANVINCTTATLMDGLKSGAAWVHRPARVATYIQHKIREWGGNIKHFVKIHIIRHHDPFVHRCLQQEKRWSLWCCHQRDLQCCFVFQFI